MDQTFSRFIFKTLELLFRRITTWCKLVCGLVPYIQISSPVLTREIILHKEGQATEESIGSQWDVSGNTIAFVAKYVL